MSYDVYWMSINLCDIVIIEMKSQSKTDNHETFIHKTSQRGVAIRRRLFAWGKRVICANTAKSAKK